MKRSLLYAFSILLPLGNCCAQVNTDFDKYIDSLFNGDKYVNAPGIGFSVMKDGSILYRKNAGMANLEHSVPFTHQTPVRLGYSGAREFMCAGLAIMEAEGLLKFDENVRTYFPKLPEWSAGVTIQDLLNHSSGFDDEWATMLLMQADMDNRVDKEQLLTMLYNQPKPQVEPGMGYMYSNSDFALLRWIMEAVAKQPLPEYLTQKLFLPLDMSSTFMNDYPDQIIPGLADTYFGRGNYYKSGSVKTSPGGNYRIVTTAGDLEKWARALEDSNSIASKAFLRLYKDARPIPVLSPEFHYLFGHEWQTIGDTKVIKHGGVNHDFYMIRIPSMEITIIGLGNSAENMARAISTADILLNNKKQKQAPAPQVSTTPVSISGEKLATYTGRYFQQLKPGHSSHIPNIVFYEIKLTGDVLQFYYTGSESFPLVAVGDGLFKDPDYGTIIQFTQSHPDSAMYMRAWPTDESGVMNFTRVNTSVIYSEKYLEQFTGQFYSKHLDFYFRIVLNENGQLIIRRPTIADKQLVPDGENRFLFEMESGDGGGWYTLAEFTRNEEGKIDGINLQHVRMMHHRFDKVN